MFYLAFLSTLYGVAQVIPADSLYLGQTPPGNTPEIFKLDVTPGSFAAERIAISKDGTEIYYSEIKSYYPIEGAKLKYYKYQNNRWTGPFLLFDGYMGPALSQTGDTMFVESDFKMFFSVRNKSEWSTLKPFFTDVDSIHYLQVTNKGNYYASARSKSSVGLADWSRIEKKGNGYNTLSLGFPINTVADNLDFYISKDESYIITCPMGPMGISYPDGYGKWSNTRYLNKKINFGLSGWGAYVTSDNKFLFYTTGTKMDYSDTHVYWVNMGSIVDSMKHTNLPPYVKNKPKGQTAVVGKPFSYTLPNDAICDDDGQPIIYEALLLDGKPLPTWLTFDSKSQILTGTPEETGDVILRINGYDDKKAMAAFRFIISIKEK